MDGCKSRTCMSNKKISFLGAQLLRKHTFAQTQQKGADLYGVYGRFSALIFFIQRRFATCNAPTLVVKRGRSVLPSEIGLPVYWLRLRLLLAPPHELALPLGSASHPDGAPRKSAHKSALSVFRDFPPVVDVAVQPGQN